MSYYVYPNFANIENRIKSFTSYSRPKILKPIICTLGDTAPEYLRVFHIAIKLDCCFNVCQPFFNFFKHLVVVELESGSESFDKFLQKLGISNHGLHVYFNI